MSQQIEQGKHAERSRRIPVDAKILYLASVVCFSISIVSMFLAEETRSYTVDEGNLRAELLLDEDVTTITLKPDLDQDELSQNLQTASFASAIAGAMSLGAGVRSHIDPKR